MNVTFFYAILVTVVYLHDKIAKKYKPTSSFDIAAVCCKRKEKKKLTLQEEYFGIYLCLMSRCNENNYILRKSWYWECQQIFFSSLCMWLVSGHSSMKSGWKVSDELALNIASLLLVFIKYCREWKCEQSVTSRKQFLRTNGIKGFTS